MKASFAWRAPRAGWGVLGAAVLLLSACGGGGGGTAETPAASAGGKPALELNSQNAADAASLAAGTGESLLQTGQFAIDVINRARSAGGGPMPPQTCPNGGLMTVTLQDRDGNARVSAGDRLVAQMQDCGVAVMSTVLAGMVVVDLTAVGAAPADALRASVNFGAAGVEISGTSGPLPGVTVSLFGSLLVDWTRSDTTTSLRVSSTAADDLRLVAAGGGRTATEAYRAIDLSKLLRFDEARSHLSMSMRMESDLLGGMVTLSTPLPLRAYLNTYPEAGRIELRGAGAAVLRIEPHFVTLSEQFDAEFDSDGDGRPEARAAYRWADVVLGYLWWDGQGTPIWSGTPYGTRNYLATDFSFSTGNFDAPGVNEVFRLQFSRPPVAGTNLFFRFRDAGDVSTFDNRLQHVAAEVVRLGALVLIRPATPLRHARGYFLEASADGVNWNGNAISLRDELGNTVSIFGGLGSFTTGNTLRAVIGPVVQLLDSASATLQLAGDASFSTTRPIASYRWTQIDGTPLEFSAPQAATTSVRWGAAAPVGVEKITVELQVTDTAGETETTRAILSVVNLQTASRILYIRGAAGDYISGGQTVVGGDSAGSWAAMPANSGYVSFSYDEGRFLSSWNLTLASADGSALKAGAYENAVRAPFHGNQNGLELFGSGRGCNHIVGRFDVIEIATDAQGLISKLAVDFEQHCETAQAPPLLGSLRINSSVPVRP